MHAISNPLSPGNRGLKVVLSRHFCASLHVGHARSIRPVFDYRITGVEAEIKTKQTNKSVIGPGSIGEIGVKGVNMAQHMGSSGCLISGLKQTKKAFFVFFMC